MMRFSTYGFKSLVGKTLRNTALLLPCVLLALTTSAQRDIFKAEISGAFAVVNSSDFALPDNPSLFAAGGRLQVNWGRAWQVGIHAGQFNFGEAADLERTYAGISLAYHWDNGALLRKRALIAPYHLLDLGYFGSADIEGGNLTGAAAAAGIENGIKIRTGDRFTLRIAHAVYRELDSRGFEETLGSSGISLWRVGIGYHFGAVRTKFTGPRFDASARFDRLPAAETHIRPVLSVVLPEKMPAPPALPKPQPSFADTAAAKEKSVAEVETAVRRDTVFLVRRDTVYLDSAGTQKFADRTQDSLFINLRDRLNYLEGLAAGLSRRDTIVALREEAAEPRKWEGGAPEAPREEKEQRKADRDEGTKATDTRAEEQPKYTTDPAIIASMERQEELIKAQNRILSQLAGKSNEVNVEVPRERRRPQVAPTVAVPVGGGGDRQEAARITALENEVRELRALLLAGTLPDAAKDTLPASDTAAATPADTLSIVSIADTLGTDTTAVSETAAEKPESARAEGVRERTEAIRTRADSIADVNLRRTKERLREEELAAAARRDTSAVSATEAPPPLMVSYPAVFKFGLNRDDVGAGYNDLFDAVAADLKNRPDMKVRITGFTDKSGNPYYNRRLSERRAQHIKQRLTERGIDASRIVIRGQGAEDAEEKWNPGDRRVEVELR